MDFFNTMRQAIVDKLETLTNLQEVYFAPRSEFAGSPVAVVSVSQNEALYNSNRVDRMTFVFQVRIYIPLANDADSVEVETNLGKAYAEVLEAFMERQVLGAAADFVEPIAGTWSYEERTSGIYHVAEVNLRCVRFMNNQG